MEPLIGIDDLAVLLNCCRRLVERMRSAGKIPKPDIKIGKMPRWKATTIRAWIERGTLPQVWQGPRYAARQLLQLARFSVRPPYGLEVHR
jgi:predicted DNA-binding transcriptional regulator AlpA